MMDGGLFGIDVADEFAKFTQSGDSITNYAKRRAGNASSAFAKQAFPHLRTLIGAGATQSIKQVLSQYRRWLAHGARWDKEKARRKQGFKTRPLSRDELVYHLALAGVERAWDRERWSRTALQKGLNLRLRQLFSKRTKKNEILQLVDLLDGWRGKHAKTKGRPEIKDMIEHEEPGLQEREYFEEYIPRPDLTAVARGTLEPRIRKKRAPSAYNIFLSTAIKQVRAANPQFDAKDAFSGAVALWREKRGTAAPARRAKRGSQFIDPGRPDSPPVAQKKRPKPRQKYGKVVYPTLDDS